MHTITEAATIKGASTSGRMLVRLIDAGQGSSGFYPAETLKAAAEAGVFHRGLHLYADHPSETERIDRPERSIRDIAGVLTEDARYDEETESLVAEAKTFAAWGPILTEMHDAIGLSIRAAAEVAEGEHDGAPARVVERIVEAQSVDFVTRAGRGGKVLSLLESARPHITQPPTDDPAPAGQTITTQESREDTMPQIEEARLRQLEEDAGRAPQLEEAVTQLTAERDAARAAANAARTAALTAQATALVAESGHPFTSLERRGLIVDVPVTESGELDAEKLRTRIEEAAAELEERARAAAGRGFGSVATDSGDLAAFDEIFGGVK